MKIMTGVKLTTASIVLAGLSACATQTPYGPAAGSGYGYTEQRIENNRYRITFRGNSLTDQAEVENSLLFRAAELTVQRGFDYFIVTEQSTDSRSTFTSSGVGSPFYAGYGYYRYPYYAYGWPWGFRDDVTTRERKRYEAIAYIIMAKGDKPEDNPNAFDARDVMNNLRPLVQRAG
ncbi:MAG: hypothetical protein AAGC95_11385 [Pseudomonadota bacterium]